MRKAFLISSVAVSSIILYYFGIHYFPDSQVDDAYILYRYAENLTSGYGFKWNPEGVFADGFTNTIWVLILSLSSWLTSYPVHEIATRVGVLTSSVSCAVSLFISYRLIQSNDWRWVAGFTPILLSLSPIFIRHSVSGMGTAVGMLTVLLFLLSLTYLPSKVGYFMSSISMFLCFLARPESIIFCAFSILSLYLFVCDDAKNIRKPTVYFISPFVILLSLFLMFRLAYFGHLFPLPFYVKSGDFSWRDGLEQSLIFISYTSPYLAFSLAYIYITNKSNLLRKITLSCILGTIVLFLYLLDVSSVMNYNFRYQSVVLPVFASISIPAVVGLKKPKGADKYLATVLIMFVTISNFGLVDKTRDDVWNDRWNRQGKIAKVLSNYENLTVASTEAGQIGYFSKNEHIDLTGLNTPSIALRGGKRGMTSSDYEQYLKGLPNLPDVYIYQTWPHPAKLDNLDIRDAYFCMKPFPKKTINVCILNSNSKFESIVSSVKGLE